MPDFKGTNNIKLQPFNEKNYYRFIIDPASTINGKGMIPFGTNVTSVAVSGYSGDGTNVSTTLINGVPVVSSNVVTVGLDWAGDGNFKLTIYTTLDNGGKYEFDFNRIKGEDT
jgi:hypothetical protein